MNVLSVYTFIYMREKKLETRDHYIPDKLQISGLPPQLLKGHNLIQIFYRLAKCINGKKCIQINFFFIQKFKLKFSTDLFFSNVSKRDKILENLLFFVPKFK